MFKKVLKISKFIVIVVLLIIMFNYSIEKVHALNGSYDNAEISQEKLWPTLEDYLYENGDCLEISFYLDPQYSVVEIAYESEGFDINFTPEYDATNSRNTFR